MRYGINVLMAFIAALLYAFREIHLHRDQELMRG